MGAFDGLAETISALIEDEGLGTDIVLTRVIAGDYDPATLKAAISETEVTVQGIVETCKRELRQGAGVVAGDLLVSIPAAQLGAPPVEDDVATLDEIAYTVVAVVTHRAGPEVVLYQLQCRRA